MKLIFHHMRKYLKSISLGMSLKLLATMAELMLPYILEHMIDNVVPLGEMGRIFLWGFLMILTALACWILNMLANRNAVKNAHFVSYDIRRALFNKTANLSGTIFDSYGLPSLTSRMTSDSYNVQSCVQSIQTLCVRAPIMMIGGIAVTMTMDPVLSGILCVMLPILLAVVLLVSRHGIPLYTRVQDRLDDVVRIMRENITGIRVVKALSKTDYERRRFYRANDAMVKQDIKASAIMSVPGPFMQTCLNIGLTLVVFVGAVRVNNGQIKPGVILAFLTYFNLILQSVMALNRMFMMISKASASADRIASVLAAREDQPVLSEDEAEHLEEPAPFIRFRHVNFRYSPASADGSENFAGGEQEQCLYDIDFSINRGESLGIIGPTGCGKTTIVNLLMRFYDVEDGAVFVDGRDVRTYEKDELHRKFGVVFQNDLIFHDTLRRNISFGRDIDEEGLQTAVSDAMAAEFVSKLDEGLDYMADVKGANLSGGQKQRILIARALAANPEILILDDSSSALDYRTDSLLRRALRENYRNTTTVIIAQRVSSILHADHILVIEEGREIGYGTHEQLLESCEVYREISHSQMGGAFT